MWLDHLPASVAFCDVETTGLGNHDRIVSFGGIGMISRDLAKGRLAYLYLVFDPGTANRRDAEEMPARARSAPRRLSSDSAIIFMFGRVASQRRSPPDDMMGPSELMPAIRLKIPCFDKSIP